MSAKTPKSNTSFLSGGGEMRELIRQKDWHNSSLGSPEQWPQSLCTTLSIILNSKFPMFLFWGPELICFYNDAYRPSLGNNGKHPDILGGRAEEYWREIWTSIKPIIDHVLAGGEANWSEDQLLPIYRNGKIEDVYWTFSYSAVYDESGNPAGVFVTCTETTKQVIALKNLAQSEEQLKFTLDAAELATWDIDPATNSLKANHRWREWFGVNLEGEIDVAQALEMVVEHDRQKVIDAMQAALQPGSDGLFDVENTMLNSVNNIERTIRSKGKAVFNEDNIAYRFSGTGQDITEQVDARKKLEESEARFHTLADNMAQLAWMADAQGWIYWYNQRWYDYTGTTLEEMQGWGWQKVHHLDHIDRVVKHLQHSWDTGEIWEDTFPLRGKDGQYRWFLSRAIPIKDEKGKVLRWFGTNTDVTEQNVLIEKLNETVNKLNLYEKVVVNMKEAVMITEAAPLYPPGPCILYVNEAFTAITGYTPEEIIGKTPSILHGPKTDQKQLHEITQALEKRQPVQAEDINYKKDGSEFYVEFEVLTLANDKGSTTHWVSVQRDVTDRKLAEKKIQESAELLRETKNQLEITFANVPAAIFLYNNKKEILFANEKAAHLLGYNTVKELIKEQYYDLLMQKVGENYHVKDENDEPFLRKNLPSVNALKIGQPGEVVFSMEKKSGGEKVWLLNKSTPILNENGEVSMVLTTSTDITVQKTFARELEQQVQARTNELRKVNDMLLQKNELLTASENFNRTLTDVSPTMVYIHDVGKNKPIFLNNTYLNFVGYNWEKVQELDHNFISTIVHPDDLAFCNELLHKVIMSQEGEVFEGNFRRKNAYDIWVPFLNRITAFKRNSKNQVTQIIGIAIDISDLKKAEDFLKQKNQDLENMNKELQSFAYISSHDLQEPLRKIQTFANRIIEKEFNNLSDTGKDYFKRMEEAASRMRTLIDDLLAYSRTNMQERKFEKANLEDIVEEVRLEFAEELEKKQAVFEAKDLCECNIIPFQMRQLIHNLISNALKFANPNHPPHIKIISKIAEGKKLAYPKLEPEKEYCHICITDNGIGFEHHYNEKIFEIFQRLHGKEKYSGTGIGLAIVKKIVDNHNGIITAKGELGKGATFDIYIPSN